MRSTVTSPPRRQIADSTPSSRYASLHRSVENGTITESGWAELLRVCLQLGKHDEAYDAYHNLESYGVRARCHGLLVDHGVLKDHQEKPRREESCVTDSALRPTLLEKLGESFEYLLEGRLPVLAVTGTVGFGFLLFFGGMLAQRLGTLAATCLVLPLAAALFAWVWMTAASIIDGTARGFDDPPTSQELGTAVFDLHRIFADLVVAVGICLTPVLLLRLVVDQALVQVPLLISACALTPVLFAIRQEYATWRPSHVRQILAADRAAFLHAAIGSAIWFLPVAVAIHANADQPLYLIVAYVGLLTVIPAILSSRVMGQTIRFLDL